jgi:glycerol-3-phosphate dehydrogenase
MAHEWAVSAEDIVWRRSKLGLRLSKDEIASLDQWLQVNRTQPVNPMREAGARS